MSALIKKDYEAPSVEVVQLAPETGVLNVTSLNRNFCIWQYFYFEGDEGGIGDGGVL